MAKICNQCQETTSVPYLVHESCMARNERHTKRLWIALIVAVALLFASHAAWLWAWMQYDYSSESYEEVIVDAQDVGNANYIGQDGNIYNGEDNSAQNQKKSSN